MHEFAICENLVKCVLSEMSDRNIAAGQLKTARMVAGGLRQIVPEYMAQAYEVLTKDTAAEGSILQTRTVPVSGECADCGWDGQSEDRVVLGCPSCGSRRVKWTGGTELFLESLEVDDGA